MESAGKLDNGGMRKQGTVVRWQAAKAFGFIRSASGQDVFFHIRDFRSGPGDEPREGMRVEFDEVHVGGKGPRALAVQPVGAAAAVARSARPTAAARPAARAKPTGSTGSGAWLAFLLMLAYTAGLAAAAWMKLLPGWAIPASIALNIAAFFAYWGDKHAAETGRWRTPESTLHFWSLAGGWPGAWFAQQVLRHKTSKASFRQAYWATVVIHCAALGAWLYHAA